MAHTPKGHKRQRKLAEKRSNAEEADKLLALHNRDYKKKYKSQSKRKSYEEMIELLGEFYKPNKTIRPAREWKSSSYNIKRQLNDFVRWIYCQYHVPSFMFEIFDDENILYYSRSYQWTRKTGRKTVLGIRKNTKLFFEWFMIIASGKSFARELKDLFSKKEAHVFLNGRPNLNIYENFWRAKLIAAGATEGLVNTCLLKFPNANEQVVADEFYYEAAKFFPRFEKEIDRASFCDIMDYVRATAYRNNRVYNFKGRTFSSLIKASNEWHKQQQLKKFGDLNYEFPTSNINDWMWYDKQDKCTWHVQQITNSKELYHEGKIMHHCVSSYSYACRDGRSFIFSLTMDDGVNIPEKCLTIELNRNAEAVQVKGKRNAQPKGRASMVFNKWCSENNIKDQHYRWW